MILFISTRYKLLFVLTVAVCTFKLITTTISKRSGINGELKGLVPKLDE